MQQSLNDNLTDADALADHYARASGEAAGTPEHRSLQQWIAASPQGERLHGRLTRGLAALDAAAADQVTFDGQIAHLIARGVAATEVEALPPARPTAHPRRWIAGALAAGIAMILVAGLAWQKIAAPVYTSVATAIGEIRKVDLPDGSAVYVNTDSRIAYTMTGKQRSVRLVQGEAYFEVAKDTARPFVVELGDYDVTVTGTAFNLKHIEGDSELVVTKGSTQLSQHGEFSGAKDSNAIIAGMRAVFSDGRSMVLVANTDTGATASWMTWATPVISESTCMIIALLLLHLC